MPDIQFKLDQATFDGLDDAIKSFYQKTEDGSYRMAQDPGLTSVLEKHKADLKKFEGYPSLEQIETWKKAESDAAAAKLAAETDADKLRSAFGEEKKGLLAQIQELTAKLNQQTINQVVADALTAVKVKAEAREMMERDLSSRMSLDAEGNPVVKDSTDTLEALVKGYQTKLPALFESDRPGGAGGGPPAGSSNGNNGEKIMTRAQWEASTPQARAGFRIEG